MRDRVRPRLTSRLFIITSFVFANMSDSLPDNILEYLNEALEQNVYQKRSLPPSSVSAITMKH